MSLPITVQATSATNTSVPLMALQSPKGHWIYKVPPGVRLSLNLDGKVLQGNEAVNGKPLKIKRTGRQWQLLAGDELLLELETSGTGAGAEMGTKLEGSHWAQAATEAPLVMPVTEAPSSMVASAAPAAESSDALAPALLSSWALPAAGAAVGLAALAGGGGGGTTITKQEGGVVSGLVMAGPVVNGHNLKVRLFDANGKQLTTSDLVVGSNGRYSVNLGKYVGVVIAVVIDGAGDVDYIDESSGLKKDLDATLMAAGVLLSGRSLELNITPLTTMASQKMNVVVDAQGQAQADGLVAGTVSAKNQIVAKAFGLADIIGGDIIATINADGTANPKANLYGKILAALSGIEESTGISTQENIDALVDQLSDATGTLSQDAVLDLLNGALEAGVDVSDVADAVGSTTVPLEVLAGLSAAGQSLYSSVYQGLPKGSIDTVAKFEALAEAVQAVMDGDATPAQLALLGIAGATEDNLKAVQARLLATPDTGLDTAQELRDVVAAAVEAFNTAIARLVAYADQTNGAVVPTAADYAALGVTGVGATGQPSVASLNSALLSEPVIGSSVDTAVEVQTLVNAYQVIFNNANTASTPDATAPQYAAVGVEGVDTEAEVSLLGSVIDKKAPSDIDTVTELQALATAVQAVMDGNASSIQLALLGVSGVTAENLFAVQAMLARTADTSLDSFTELQSAVTAAISAYNAARTRIAAYADNPSGTAPTAADYQALGVTGVAGSGQPSVDMINSVLASTTVVGTAANSTEEVQAIVNASQVVLNNAENALSTDATAAQYLLMGVTGWTPRLKWLCSAA